MSVSAVSLVVLLSSCFCSPQRSGIGNENYFAQAFGMMERFVARVEQRAESDVDTYLADMKLALGLQNGEEKKLRGPALQALKAEIEIVKKRLADAEDPNELAKLSNVLSGKSAGRMLRQSKSWNAELKKHLTKEQAAVWATLELKKFPPRDSTGVAGAMLLAVARLEETIPAEVDKHLTAMKKVLTLKKENEAKLREAAAKAIGARLAEMRVAIDAADGDRNKLLGVARQFASPTKSSGLAELASWQAAKKKHLTEQQIAKWKASGEAKALLAAAPGRGGFRAGGAGRGGDPPALQRGNQDVSIRMADSAKRAITSIEDTADADMDRYLRSMKKVLELKNGDEQKLREGGMKIVKEKFAKLRERCDEATNATEIINVMREFSVQRPTVSVLLADSKAWLDLQGKHLTKEQVQKWKASAELRALTLPVRRPIQAAAMAPPRRGGAAVLRAGVITSSSNISRYTTSINRLERSLRSILEAELAVISSSCRLSADQHRHLEIAIKGSIKREFGPQLEELADLETKFEGQKNSRDAMAAAASIYTKARSYSRSPDFWRKAVESTLTKEQQTRWIEENTAREIYQTRSWVILTVLALDRTVSLNADQRSQLEQRLLEFSTSKDGAAVLGRLPSSQTRGTAYARLPTELRSLCDNILTETQKEAISRSPYSTSNIRTRSSETGRGRGGR